jgi:3-deoxy-D-arabino-heptulosonate 7-phosphate (DAHP) synthase
VLTGVKEVRMIESAYKLCSARIQRGFPRIGQKARNTLANVEIGGETPVNIAGPAPSNAGRCYSDCRRRKRQGAHIMRADLQPRSSAHSFLGLGSKGDDEHAKRFHAA